MLSPAFVVPPEDIEQSLVFWEGDPQANADRVFPFRGRPAHGQASRLERTAEAGLRSQSAGGPPRRPDLRPHRIRMLRWAGESTCPTTGRWSPPREDLLRELIEDRNAPPPRQSWDEAWKKVAKGQLNLAVDTRWLRRRFGPRQRRARRSASGQTQSSRRLSPLLEKARSYALGIDASDRQITVDLQARAGSEEDAKPVAETLQAFVTLGKNAAKAYGTIPADSPPGAARRWHGSSRPPIRSSTRPGSRLPRVSCISAADVRRSRRRHPAPGAGGRPRERPRTAGP